jgi:hypothetical protein
MQEKESPPSWKNVDQTLLVDEGITCLKQLAKVYMKYRELHKMGPDNYTR